MLLIKQEISHSPNKHLFLNDKHNTRTLLGLLQWMRLKPTSSLLQLVLFPSYSDWKVAKTLIILEFWYIKTRNLHVVWIFAFIFKCVFVCVCMYSFTLWEIKKQKNFVFSSLMLTYFFLTLDLLGDMILLAYHIYYNTHNHNKNSVSANWFI